MHVLHSEAPPALLRVDGHVCKWTCCYKMFAVEILLSVKILEFMWIYCVFSVLDGFINTQNAKFENVSVKSLIENYAVLHSQFSTEIYYLSV